MSISLGVISSLGGVAISALQKAMLNESLVHRFSSHLDSSVISDFSLIPFLFSNATDWYQILMERNTDHLIQLCQKKQQPPEGYLIQAIRIGQKNWVPILLDCGSSPNEKIGYLTPSLAWAVRYPKDPLPSFFKSSPFEREFIETKLLSHVFEVEGEIKINDSIVNLEMFEPGYFLKRIIDITNEIENHNQTLSNTNSLSLFKDAVLSADSELIHFEDFPVQMIESGYAGSEEDSGHVTAMVLSEHYMAEVDEGVSIYRYNSELLFPNLKNILSPFSFLSKEMYDSILRKLHLATDATPIPILQHIEDRPLNQEVGNCAWKSIESSIFATRVLELLESLYSKFKKIEKECFLDGARAVEECENLVDWHVEEWIEDQGAKKVSRMLQDHRDLVETIKDVVLENYFSYRLNLSKEVENEIPVNWDFMLQIKNQMQKLRSFYRQSVLV